MTDERAQLTVLTDEERAQRTRLVARDLDWDGAAHLVESIEAAVLARVGKQLADTERLDWLMEQHGTWAMEDGCCGHGIAVKPGENLRAAIDRARSGGRDG